MTLDEVTREIRSRGKPNTVRIYQRRGVTEPTVGMSCADPAALVKLVGVNHPLALRLWGTGLHDARILATKVARWGVAAMMSLALTQVGDRRDYVDAARGFSFSYPAAFGAPSPGTNDGFADRVAAIRFAVFSAGLGGEAALTRGRPVVDLQAAGGLYDAIALEIFPDDVRRVIVQALPPLSAENFCQQLALEQHLDPQVGALSQLTEQQRAAISSADRLRNVNPQVVQCTVSGTIVTFDKEAAFQPGGPRQHVYGAIRFLEPPYATFQIVRAGPAPDPAVLDDLSEVVRSWNPL
jgi:hypothetical protein